MSDPSRMSLTHPGAAPTAATHAGYLDDFRWRAACGAAPARGHWTPVVRAVTCPRCLRQVALTAVGGGQASDSLLAELRPLFAGLPQPTAAVLRDAVREQLLDWSTNRDTDFDPNTEERLARIPVRALEVLADRLTMLLTPEPASPPPATVEQLVAMAREWVAGGRPQPDGGHGPGEWDLGMADAGRAVLAVLGHQAGEGR